MLKPHRAVFVANAAGPASECVAALGPGGRICGVTKGQFGVTELLGAMLAKFCPEHGPADVTAWSWSMAPDDARMIAGFRREGLIRELVVLFDRSFPRRHPEWVPLLRESLGHAIYATNNHAKVVLVAMGPLRWVVQTSMNFNINVRFEHFSVEDDADLFAHWEALTRWIVSRTKPGLENFTGPEFLDGFRTAMGGANPEKMKTATGNDSSDLDSLSDVGGFDFDALLAGMDL